jgi:hypothetical protein
MRWNSGTVRNAGQATATPPPLGGVSECFRGRSSDSAGSSLLAGLPSAVWHQCHLGLSYLLTAAGQSRIHTGFPFDSPRGETMERPLYLGQCQKAIPFLVDILLKFRKLTGKTALQEGDACRSMPMSVLRTEPAGPADGRIPPPAENRCAGTLDACPRPQLSVDRSNEIEACRCENTSCMPQSSPWRFPFALSPSRFGEHRRVGEDVLREIGGAVLWNYSHAKSPEKGRVPDRYLIPGLTRPVSISEVCSMPHEEVIREVPNSLRQQIFEEYGVKVTNEDDYEIDYLIAPGLGGADDIHNLWPEPYKSPEWNAPVKDAHHRNQ